MLTNEEAGELYLQIITALSQSNLFWITSQVQEEIARGKVITKSLRDISIRQIDIFGGPGQRKSNQTQTFLISETYTAKEQLTLLLSALNETTIIQSIRNEILSTLKIF